MFLLHVSTFKDRGAGLRVEAVGATGQLGKWWLVDSAARWAMVSKEEMSYVNVFGGSILSIHRVTWAGLFTYFSRSWKVLENQFYTFFFPVFTDFIIF